MEIIEWQRREKAELLKLVDMFGLEEIEIELNDDIIKNEKILQDCTNLIRTKWLKKVNDLTSMYNQSPWRGQEPKDINGQIVPYTYGTLVNDEHTSKLLEGFEIKGREKRTYLYNNGMAAIRGTIDIINSFIRDNIKIMCDGGYFETRIYIETLKNCGFSVNSTEDNEYFNVFFAEPIQYLLHLPKLDIERFIAKITTSKAKVKFVIIDSTMDCSTHLFSIIESKIRNNQNIIYIEVRSGIKQDQFGLELANLGISTWYISKKNKNFGDCLFQYIKTHKDIVGDNISYNKMMIISKCSFEKSIEYKNLIHRIAYDFYRSLVIESHKYILEIIYPRLETDYEILSMPFIFIKFRLSYKESYEILLDNIINVCKRKGIFLPYRNSFGFRYPSIEYIYDFKTKECVMKISLGVYKGALYNELLSIINDMGNEKFSQTKLQLIQNIKEWGDS